MNVLSLDLELNKEGDHTTDICQIGAVVGDLQTGEIFEELSVFIKTSKPLDPFIIKLCGISQETIDTFGVSLQEGYQKLCDLASKYEVYPNVMTWGGGDAECIRQQLNLEYKDFAFGRRWLDVKTLYQLGRMAAGEKPQSGLSKSMARSGINFFGRCHDALADARNTFRLAHHLLHKPK